MGHTDTIQTNKYTAHIPSITVSQLGAEVKRFLQQISQHSLISGRQDTKCSRQTWSDQETQHPLSVQYSPHSPVQYSPHSSVQYSPHSSVQYSPHSSVQYSPHSSRQNRKKRSLVPAWSVPSKGQNNKRKTLPNQSRYPGKLTFKESVSLPLAGHSSFHDLHSLPRTNKSFSNRLLPCTPDSEHNENKITTKRNLKRNPQNLEESKKFDERDQRRKTEPLQRTIVYCLPNKIGHCEGSTSHNSLTDADEEHIYEEVVDEEEADSDDNAEDVSFLTLISSERRKNLIFYGCTDWDF